MGVSLSVVKQFRLDSENYISGTETIAGDACQVISDTIPTPSTTAATAFLAFAQAKLKAIEIVSDQDLTLHFTGPTLAVSLTAGVVWGWELDSGLANPFGSTTVTAVTADNASGVDALLQARVVTIA